MARLLGIGKANVQAPSHVALFDDLFVDPEVRHTFLRLGFISHRSFFHELIWDDSSGAQDTWLRVRVRRLVLLRKV